jgi:2-C-methyl-D-erythritol 4-phosphate cytidylyltransferase
MTPSLKVVVAITSPIAFQEISNRSILETCLETSREFISKYGSNAHLAIAGTKEALAQIANVDCEKIQCDPNNPEEFGQSLRNAAPTDLLMIHDSQRALTKITQFDRVLEALASNIDAVRPVSAFTETLKSINTDQFVEGTIDRDSMKRVSTPELIRYNAIDCAGGESTWFVRLNAGAQISTVEAEAESARINSDKELELMKHLLERN